MTVILPLAALLLFTVGAVAWKLRDNAILRESARNDTVRAGKTGQPTGEGAARRVQGSYAWTRGSDATGF